MKRFIILLSALFCINAIAHTTDWYVDGILYQSTTCTSGDNITPPNPPSKPGYHLVDWIPYRIPLEYTELEYIQSSGTQYIDTGYVPNANTRVAAKYYMTSGASTYPMVFGVTNGNTLPQFSLYRFSNFMYYTFGRTASGDNDISITTTPFNTLHTVDCNKNVFTLDNTTVTDFVPSDIGISHPLYIFARNNANSTIDNYSNAKLYEFKIWDNDVLTANFIPAKNSSGVVGMYDTVSKRFFTNAGTGVFIAGPEVH